MTTAQTNNTNALLIGRTLVGIRRDEGRTFEGQDPTWIELIFAGDHRLRLSAYSEDVCRLDEELTEGCMLCSGTGWVTRWDGLTGCLVVREVTEPCKCNPPTYAKPRPR